VYAEQAICGILLYRAAFTHVMFANEILTNLFDEAENGEDFEEEALARRIGAQQEYNRAVSALGKANDIVLKNLNALGVVGEGEGKGVLEELLGKLRRENP
jgi:hypothetical protein